MLGSGLRLGSVRAKAGAVPVSSGEAGHLTRAYLVLWLEVEALSSGHACGHSRPCQGDRYYGSAHYGSTYGGSTHYGSTYYGSILTVALLTMALLTMAPLTVALLTMALLTMALLTVALLTRRQGVVAGGARFTRRLSEQPRGTPARVERPRP